MLLIGCKRDVTYIDRMENNPFKNSKMTALAKFGGHFT